jgi:GT2 family glycosyltransferase
MNFESTKSKYPSTCIAILNWNGIKHLKHLLPSVLKATSNYWDSCPIIVLDNQSTEPDQSWLATNYPQIEVVIAQKNDYLFSYNWLLRSRKEEVVILLNNDLRVDENFIVPLLRHFSEPSVFAVTARAYDWKGVKVTSGPSLFQQHWGWFHCGFDTSRQYACYTLFASGGYMAVDRKKFLELGGFDRLFFPAYGEDLDLGYRAWCRRWKSIYEPASIVYHRESGSWDANGDKRSSRLILQAQFLFQWRNLRQWDFQLKHMFYLHWLWFRQWLRGNRNWLEAYREAKKSWKMQKEQALKNAPFPVKLSFLKKIGGKPIRLQEQIK